MDSRKIREMSIANAKLAMQQNWGWPAPYSQIIEALQELREQNNKMDKIHYLDDAGFEGLTKIYDWMLNTYSNYGYVDITGKREFVIEYLKITNKILTLRQYTEEEKQILNELRIRYIKKDLEVDDSLPF